ncbi:hypothetical protein ACFL4W_03910 [Planctomycetota bacterium]
MRTIFAVLTCMLVCWAGGPDADEILLDDGTCLKGMIQPGSFPGPLLITTPWSKQPLGIDLAHVIRIDFGRRKDPGFIADILLQLQNGSRLPARFKKVTATHVHVTAADGREYQFPWEKVTALVFAQKEELVFSSARDGWQLDKWKGDRTGYSTATGRIARTGMGYPERPLELPLPADLTFPLHIYLRGSVEGYGDIVLAQVNKQPYRLRTDCDEEYGRMSILSLHGNKTAPRSEGSYFVDRENVDLHFVLTREELRMNQGGQFAERLPIKGNVKPVFKLGEDTTLAIKELTIVSGTRFPSLGIAGKEAITVFLKNTDALSAPDIDITKDAVSFSLHGNPIRVPFDRIKGIRFGKEASLPAPPASLEYAEAAASIRVFGRGTLAAISAEGIVLTCPDGLRLPLPRNEVQTLYISSRTNPIRSPAQILAALAEGLKVKKPREAAAKMGLPNSGLIMSLEDVLEDAEKVINAKVELPAKADPRATPLINTRVFLLMDYGGGEPDEWEEHIKFLFSRTNGRWFVFAEEYW